MTNDQQQMTMRFFLSLLSLFVVMPVAAQPLAEAAWQALAARYPAEAPALEVRIDRAADAVLNVDTPLVVWPADADVPRGRVQVRVQDATGRDAGVAMLFVAHFDSVVVTRGAVASGDEVDASALEAVWRETTRLRGGWLRARDLATMPEALFATRYLRADVPLRPGDLRPPYAAEPGQPVDLRYTRGAVAFTLRAEAREAGHVGDTIRLFLSDTRTTYRARLTAPGEAVWVETL